MMTIVVFGVANIRARSIVRQGEEICVQSLSSSSLPLTPLTNRSATFCVSAYAVLINDAQCVPVNGVHSACPILFSVDSPGAHALHRVLLLFEMNPIEQTKHSSVPVSFAIDPGLQGSQVICLDPMANVPGGQIMHLSIPVSFAIVPGLQGSQVDCPDPLTNVPGEQGAHFVSFPNPMLPGPQFSHSVVKI